jgi:histidine ammonia-lyase
MRGLEGRSEQRPYRAGGAERLRLSMRQLLANERRHGRAKAPGATSKPAGPETRRAYEVVRAISKKVDADRSLAPDIEAVAEMIGAGKLSAILH